jgi:hypothetical protein
MAKKTKDELPKTVVIFPYQTGMVKDIFADAVRKALAPGKRLSRSNKTYWETRKNRSDTPGKNI